MKIFLTEVRSDDELASHEFNQETIRLGRDPALNDLAFERARWPMVSRRHAEIRFDNGSWYIADAGSVNGTFLNGEQISQRTPLPPQSRIRLAEDGPELAVD